MTKPILASLLLVVGTVALWYKGEGDALIIIAPIAFGVQILVTMFYRWILEFEPESSAPNGYLALGLVWAVGSFIVAMGVPRFVDIVGLMSLAYLGAGLVMVVGEGIYQKIKVSRKRKAEREIAHRVSA